mgnify:CR=1 FL=1
MLPETNENPVFIALTRPTCVLGVGVDYLFFVLIAIYSLFLLVDDPRLFVIAIPCLVFGRWCYAKDSALIVIFQKRLRYLNQFSYQQLGGYVYDCF